jgi:hypothetical protein
MQAQHLEGLEGDLSLTQPPSRDENSWVVERTPARLDAERAHHPLDLGFVQSFKHALLGSVVNDVQYLNDSTEAVVRTSGLQNMHVSAISPSQLSRDH